MQAVQLHKLPLPKQLSLAVFATCLISAVCFACTGFLGYRVVALILLLTVSLAAMFLDIIPVIFAACLSAFIWDFFFIPPHFTLHVDSTEDAVLLLTYFIIALVNAVLTHRIRRAEKESLKKEERALTVKLYNKLLDSLSHELRTPITAILGATDNLQHNSKQLSPKNRFDLLGEISTASLRLNMQVDNLLNMSRIEAGFIGPRADWCDINELVYDVVKKIEDGGSRQRIGISINPDLPLFKVDKSMLEQVVSNLLYNATLYTDGSDRIDVTAVCHVDVLELTIEDTGKGFPQEDLGRVFSKFYRLDSAKVGGTGLGLPIVKGFTEAMGGRIAVINKREGGAKFILQIPAETSYLKNQLR